MFILIKESLSQYYLLTLVSKEIHGGGVMTVKLWQPSQGDWDRSNSLRGYDNSALTPVTPCTV